MASISRAKHYNLTSAAKASLSKINEVDEAKESLHKDMAQLEILFEEYLYSLSQLYELIKTYDAVQHRLKITLRKQQVVSIRKNLQNG